MRTKKPIDRAIEVLQANITAIGTVTEWARVMGYSRSYFSKRFHEIFGCCAIEVLIGIKFSLIVQIISEHPERESDYIARLAGFSNAQALRRFLRYNYHINITGLRERCREKNSTKNLVFPLQISPNKTN